MAKRTPLATSIRVYRATHGLTQWALGKKLGIDATMMSMIETDKRLPTPEQQKKLEKLGIVAAELERTA